MLQHECRTLHLIARCGLGNRLFAIAAALRLIDNNIFDILEINWEPDQELPLELHEVLNGPFIANRIRPSTGILHSYYTNQSVVPPSATILEMCSVFKLANDPTPIEQIDKEIANSMRKLSFVDDFYKKADNYNVSGRVGLHCRRSDYPFGSGLSGINDTISNHHRFIDQNFAEAIAELWPDKKFFLASDSENTNLMMAKRFGDRLNYAPKTHYPAWTTRSQECMREGIIDFILLSRCDFIVADSASTFSHAAAWMGGKDRIMWKRPRAQ